VNRLNLFILPTEKCNFRCIYCYEDYKIGKMNPLLVNGIKKLLLKRFSDLNNLEISWFGGEPLLAKDIIFDISDFILKNAPESLNYISEITTNGFYLNKNVFENLIKLKIRFYQISLDGDEEMHNSSRIRKNGKPTFDVIWKNLIDIKNTDFDFFVSIRIHFTMDNYNKLDNLINKLNDSFSGDKRFKIFFKPIERLGGNNDSSIKIMSLDEKRIIKKNLENRITDSSQIYSINEKTPYICYASKPNSLIIRANGKICKCTVALDNDENFIGEINEDGEIIFNKNYYKWIRGIESLNAGTLKCPLYN
jgi:uncharacterized protein